MVQKKQIDNTQFMNVPLKLTFIIPLPLIQWPNQTIKHIIAHNFKTSYCKINHCHYTINQILVVK